MPGLPHTSSAEDNESATGHGYPDRVVEGHVEYRRQESVP